MVTVFVGVIALITISIFSQILWDRYTRPSATPADSALAQQSTQRLSVRERAEQFVDTDQIPAWFWNWGKRALPWQRTQFLGRIEWLCIRNMLVLNAAQKDALDWLRGLNDLDDWCAGGEGGN
jgi:hypothetical protein